MTDRQNPIRATDADALALARGLSRETLGALAVLDPSGFPAVSRASVVVVGEPVLLVSDLSHHTRAMRADPRVSLLLGTPPRENGPVLMPTPTDGGATQSSLRRALYGSLVKSRSAGRSDPPL